MAPKKKAVLGRVKVAKGVTESGAGKLARLSRGRSRQGGALFPVAPARSALVQRVVAQLPWGDLICLLQRVKSPEIRRHRHVVIELKACKFRPGDGAQLGMYMARIDCTGQETTDAA